MSVPGAETSYVRSCVTGWPAWPSPVSSTGPASEHPAADLSQMAMMPKSCPPTGCSVRYARLSWLARHAGTGVGAGAGGGLMVAEIAFEDAGAGHATPPSPPGR